MFKKKNPAISLFFGYFSFPLSQTHNAFFFFLLLTSSSGTSIVKDGLVVFVRTVREVHTNNVHTSVDQLGELFNVVGLGTNGTNDRSLASSLRFNINVHVGDPLHRVLNLSRLLAIVEHFGFDKKIYEEKKPEKKKG
jgi:hypothetical protein